jgi:hypothetical protein
LTWTPRRSAPARQPVLQERADARGAVYVGRHADQPEQHGGARRPVREQQDGVGIAVRGGHGEDGEHRRAHWRPRRGQVFLQQSKLAGQYSSDALHDWSPRISLMPVQSNYSSWPKFV